MGSEELTFYNCIICYLLQVGEQTHLTEKYTQADTELHMLFSAHSYIFIVTQFETHNHFVSQSASDFA